MRTSWNASLSCLVLCTAPFAAISARAAATAPPPAEAFGAIPQMRGVVLSPNGNMLAWIRDDETEGQILMYDLAAQKAKRSFGVGRKAKTRGLVWIDDETLIIQVSVTAPAADNTKRQFEFIRLLAADAAGGAARALLNSDSNFNYVTSAQLLTVRPSKAKAVYLSTLDFSTASRQQETGTHLAGHRKDSGWIGTLFEVDTVSGKGRIIARGTPFTTDWAVDRSGRVLARSEWNPGQHQYRLSAADGSGWRDIVTQNDERLALVGLSTDATAILAIGTRGEGRVKAWSIPLDGSAPTVLAEDAERDVTSLIYDGVGMKPVAVGLSGIHPEQRWLDKAAESRYLPVALAFRGSRIESYQESQDHRRALVLVESPTRPPVYYVVDFTTSKAIIVGDKYPALANAALGEASMITYAARDGISIPAIQTLPPGSAGKNLPLVVLPHGGPHSHDDYAFDWLAQFLATRGYAVLQPQFRGSTGYGEAFRRAGDHQWGGLMQDDVTDGVKALVANGVADPRHICIVGASYGGYAALAGAAFTPDLYSCAISVSGIGDLPAFFGYLERQSGEESDDVAYWKANIGSLRDANMILKSPIQAAAAVKVPILLIHGMDDTVVPIAQSESMARALQAAGKKVTLVKLSGEDHWLSRSETRIRVLKEIEAFLGANLRTP
jgi:dipeptidyl aminopeptidase/acylaminoacyl peptidase